MHVYTKVNGNPYIKIFQSGPEGSGEMRCKNKQMVIFYRLNISVCNVEKLSVAITPH